MKKTIKTIEGYWYRTPLIIMHTCCKCNSKHIVEFKIKGKRLYSRWKPIKKARLKNSQ
jgi:hypothetical protein